MVINKAEALKRTLLPFAAASRFDPCLYLPRNGYLEAYLSFRARFPSFAAKYMGVSV